jgi:glycerol-3-phosphate dehydrogenase (NAD(P)+)
MVRLGVALGANITTFNGLSGLGDLVLTCSDDLSRNRRFGKALANNHQLPNPISFNDSNICISMCNVCDKC